MNTNSFAPYSPLSLPLPLILLFCAHDLHQRRTNSGLFPANRYGIVGVEDGSVPVVSLLTEHPTEPDPNFRTFRTSHSIYGQILYKVASISMTGSVRERKEILQVTYLEPPEIGTALGCRPAAISFYRFRLQASLPLAPSASNPQ